MPKQKVSITKRKYRTRKTGGKSGYKKCNMCHGTGRIKEYTNSEIIAMINEHIHSERNRSILKRRLVDGITFEKLAEEFDLSVSQIKRIVYKCENDIF